MTLHEAKRMCTEMQEKYGSGKCCYHCKLYGMGCSESPDEWELPPEEPAEDWEGHFKSLLEDYRKLRLVVRTVEAVLGIKLEEV